MIQITKNSFVVVVVVVVVVAYEHHVVLEQILEINSHLIFNRLCGDCYY